MRSPAPVVRLFLGAPAPPSPVYRDVTRRLLEVHDGLRPVPDSGRHLTLRFLGEVDDPVAVDAAAKEALAGHTAMPCQVAGVGGFPAERKARVVWAGVEADGLAEMERDLREASAHLGQPPGTRPFHAHITLARAKRPVDLSGDPGLLGTRFAEGVLDRVVLWRSTLTPEGAVHEPLSTYRLSRGSGGTTA